MSLTIRDLVCPADEVGPRRCLVGRLKHFVTGPISPLSVCAQVFFRKVMSDCGPGPVSVFLSLIALISTLLLWPVALALSLSGIEVVTWTQLPWLELSGAAGLLLGERGGERWAEWRGAG